MIANYHTHTTLCRHATGEEKDYVERAIGAGMRILGFSDHTPQLFDPGYYSDFRMFPEQLGEYVARVERVQDAYRGKIEIHIGLEVEYYPKLFKRLLDYIADYPIEYMLLGQHALENEWDSVECKYPTSDDRLLARYCDQVIEAMETGRFSYLAHPDVFNYTGEPRTYDREMRRLCRAARRLGMPMEINFLGIAKRRNYPSEVFWRIAAEEGCDAVFGCDAHAPEQIGDMDVLRRAEAFAEKCGLNVLDTVELKPCK